MSSIDRRIVDMQFNNRDFQRNARDSVKTLEELKKALNLEGAADGMASVEKSGGRFSLRNIVDSVKNAAENFPILGAVGFSAINRLTNAAIDFGKGFVNSVVKPIKEGGWQRAMNLEQAQFQLEGLGIAWDDIRPAILGAVKGTAYGLDSAAKAAAQLSASQVPLDRMESSLRAISGVAAMTGSDYDSIASIFTKVAGQGRVMGDDLLRMSSRGMNAAATLAEAMNLTEAEVRQMVTEGKISFEMFADAMDGAFGEHATKANETYAGSLSNLNAALARVGAESATIKMEKHRRMFNALIPVVDTLAEGLEPLWELLGERADRSAQAFENAMSWIVDTFADDFAGGMEGVVGGLRNIYGFFDRVADTAKNAWQAVFPSGDGGPSTFFTAIGRGFETLTGWLNNTDGLLDAFGKGLEFVFRGIKTGLDNLGTAWDAIGVGFSWIAEQAQWLWGAISPVLEQIQGFFSGLNLFGGSSGGSLIDELRISLINLRDKAMVPITAVIEFLREALDRFLASVEGGKARVESFFQALADTIESMRSGTSTVDSFGARVGAFFGRIGQGIQDAWARAQPYIERFGNFMRNFGQRLKDGFSDLDANDVLAAVSTGVMAAYIAGFIALIKRVRDAIKTTSDSIAGITEGITEALTSLTGVFTSMQNNIRADTLVKIASAIAILAAALWLLAMVDVSGLEDATLAMFALMGGMTAFMLAMTHLSGFKGYAKLPIVAGSMVVVATAVATLAGALALLALVDSDRLMSATTALVIAMGAMAGLSAVLAYISKAVNPVGLMALAVALGAITISLAALSGIVVLLGMVDYEVLNQGLTTMGIILGGLVISGIILAELGPRLLVASVGMMAMATALIALVAPIILLGLIPWPILVQGMQTMAIMLGGLTIAAIVLGTISPQMMKAAAGLMAMAVALNIMIPAILILGMIDMNNLLQGLGGVGAALLLLVIAANAMTKAVPGAIAMISMATALTILTAAVLGMASVPFGHLMAGLLGVAVALGILIAAGYLAMGAAPGLLALSVASIALGAGMLMLSVGLLLFGPAAAVAAGGIALLAIAAEELAPHLLAMIAAGVGLALFGAGLMIVAAAMLLLGAAMLMLGIGLTMLAASAAPATAAVMAMVDELTEISLLDMGKLALVSVSLLALGVALLALGVGSLAAGVGILAFTVAWAAFSIAVMMTAGPVTSRLEDMATRIPPLMSQLASAMTSSGAQIVQATSVIVAAFATLSSSITSAITSSVGAARSGGQQLGMALVQGVISAVPAVRTAGMLFITTLVAAISSGLNRINQLATQLTRSFVQTLTRANAQVRNAGNQWVRSLSTSLNQGVRLARTAGTSIVRSIVAALNAGVGSVRSSGMRVGSAAANGVISAARSGVGGMRITGINAGRAFSNGVASGIRSGGYGVSSAARSVANNAARAARAALKVASPSRVGMEIGRFFDLGVEHGLLDGISGVEQASAHMGNSAVDALRDAINQIGDKVFEEIGDDFTITPILDLSQVENDASRLSSLLEPSIGVTSRAGSRASSLTEIGVPVPTSVQTSSTNVTFQQTNNSPKALSNAEIYRRTKNQLSVLRESLDKR